MAVKKIEVTPHARNPVGSFAVIKLFGISRLDGAATFRLDPVIAADASPPVGWLQGALRPLGVRAGPGAVELLIGPDIVKHQSLQPGTHVRFRMPSIEAEATIEWPNLSGEPVVDLAISAAAPSLIPSTDGVDSSPPSLVGRTGAKEQALARLQPRGTIARSPISPAKAIPLKPAVEVTDLSTDPAAHAHSGFRQRAEAQPSPAPPRQSSSFLPLALGLVIVAAMLITFLRTTTVEGSGVTLFSALRSTVTGPNETAVASNNSSLVLGEILEVGTTSPAGVDASDVTQREALERANDLLGSMKTPADRLEVAFWLRKALSRSLSEPRLVWAITQLGTAYVSKDKTSKPNYDAARLLWRWATDAGDAQAACFLGRLYERGLGVPRNSKLALKNYGRARKLGGCPGLDQAILRIKDQS